MGLLEKLQARLELYRLEQRYTRRHRRTTFTTAAHYVDGEYIYTSSPASATNSSSSSTTTTDSRRFNQAPSPWTKEVARSRSSRYE